MWVPHPWVWKGGEGFSVLPHAQANETLAATHQVDNLQLVARLHPDARPEVALDDFAVVLDGDALGAQLQVLEEILQREVVGELAGLAV